MKKNPGRKERRRQARINRREAGRERAKANELAQKWRRKCKCPLKAKNRPVVN